VWKRETGSLGATYSYWFLPGRIAIASYARRPLIAGWVEQVAAHAGQVDAERSCSSCQQQLLGLSLQLDAADNLMQLHQLTTTNVGLSVSLSVCLSVSDIVFNDLPHWLTDEWLNVNYSDQSQRRPSCHLPLCTSSVRGAKIDWPPVSSKYKCVGFVAHCNEGRFCCRCR